MILLCQLQDKLSSHDKRLFVGQGDGLAGTNGMDGGRKPGKAHHGREYYVDGLGLNNLVKGTGTSIDLHVGQVGHERFQLVIALFIGNDHGSRVELVGLLGQQCYAIVGRKAVGFIEVAMLFYDLKSLRANTACGAQYGYLPFH